MASSVLATPALAQVAVDQLPTGGQVVAGQAGIEHAGAVMSVNQSSARAAIEWATFDVGAAAEVRFNQPSSDSATLNRVLDSDPSRIFGRITAPGQVFLANPSGVYFGPGASVDVGGLVAATHRISVDDFMAGRTTFDRNGATGAVVNAGDLGASLGGYIALLAPEVRNEGVIVAGAVALASGEAVTLDFGSNGALVGVTATKSQIAALVENKAAVIAPGGLIILTAQAASSLQGGVVNNTGALEAAGLVADGGRIILDASDSITHTGSISVDAAAGSAGDGGTALIVADLATPSSRTTIDGAISARGGDRGGDGGFIETSASHLSLGSSTVIDAAAPNGRAGDWLIDPYDYVIGASEAAVIESALDGANVEVTTSADIPGMGSIGAGSGDITVSAAITHAGANMLTLTAASGITVNAPISVGALTLNGPGGIALGADLTTRTGMTLNGAVTLLGDTALASAVSGDVVVNGAISNSVSRNLEITASGGDIALLGNLAVGSGSPPTPLGDVTLIAGGEVRLGASGSPISVAAASLDITADTLAAYAGGASFTCGAASVTGICLTTSTRLDIAGTGSWSGALSGATSLTSAGAGKVILTGVNTYTGDTTVSAGILEIGGLGSIGTPNSGGFTYAGNIDVGVGQLRFNSAVHQTLAGVMSGATPSGGFINSPGAGFLSITTLGNADKYGFFADVYLIPSGSLTSVYGDAPSVSYGLWTTASGGAQINDASPSGSVVLKTASNVAITGATTTGTYSATYDSGLTLGTERYTLLAGNAVSWVVAPRALNVSVAKTYDGLAGLSSGFTVSGMVNGDAAPTVTGAAAVSSADAGVYASFASSTLGLSNANYTLTGGAVAATITAAPLTITANDASQTYDGLAYAGGNGVGYAGFVNGETASVLGGTLGYAGTSQGAVNAGSYVITPTGLTSGNYVITAVDGALSITKAPLTVTANDANETYDGLAYSGGNGVGYSGFVNGETASVLGGTLGYAGTSQGAVNAGSYIITPTGLTSANYAFTMVDGALTIGKAPLTVTANDATRIYDGLAYSGGNGVGYSGFMNGETASVLGGTLGYAGTSQGAVGAGSYVITPTGLTSANYAITAVDGALTVAKAPLTVTASSGSVTYNGLTQAVSGFTASGFVNGETIAVLGGVTTSGGSGRTAGTYAHVASGADDNYDLAFVDGVLTIVKAHATVTANSGTAAYTGLTQGVTGFAATGLVNGETASVLTGVSTAGGSGRNAGVYAHVATGTDHNYALTFADGRLVIEKASATVIANSATVNFNGRTQSVTGFTATGLVNGETAGVLGGVATGGGSGRDVGVYAHTASGVDGNYDLTFLDGALTVEEAVLTTTVLPPVVEGGAAQGIQGVPVAPRAASSADGPGLSVAALALPASAEIVSLGAGAASEAVGGAPAAGGVQMALDRSGASAATGPALGTLAVTVPPITAASDGFSFRLPPDVREAVDGALGATLADGAPLPSWLSFDPAAQTFEVTLTPDASLPIEIVVIGASGALRVVISERSE